MKNNVLDNFQKLMKGDENAVAKSTLSILKHLTETEGNELLYTLNRLVRGLGATKSKVQANYFTTLVAILNAVPDIEARNLFDIMKKTLQSSSSNSKGENAEIYAGQILACGAIIRSTLFIKLSKQEQREVLETIFNAGKQRSYLQLEAYVFIVDLLKIVNEEQYIQLIHPVIKDDILKNIEEHSLDSLYLLLSCMDYFPGQFKKKPLHQFFGGSRVVCEENMKVITNIIMNTPTIKSVNHPAYDLVLKKISTSCLYKFLDEFDAVLLKPNYNRHLIAARVLDVILQNTTDEASVSLLLTSNFMQHTLHYFKAKNLKNAEDDLARYLRDLFKTLVNKLVKFEKADATLSVFSKLIFWPGCLTFDQITKTNTVNDIINNMNCDGVKGVIKIYGDILSLKACQKSDTEKWLNSDRLFAANALTRLLRHPSIADDLQFRQEQIINLMTLSLFKNDTVSTELSNSLKKTFYSALDQKFAKLEHLCSVLSNVIRQLETNLQQNKTLLQPLDDNTKKTWNETLKFINKLEKKKKKDLNNVFYTMFLLMALQLFQHPKLAEDCLNELFHCYDRIKDGKKREKNEDEATSEPDWIEVVVDLFLNLLSQNSHLLRNMISSVFPHLCKHLTTSAIHQILYVLDPKNEINPLKEDDNEVEDENNVNGHEDSLTEEEDESSGDDEPLEDEIGNEDDTINDKLRLALQEVLKDGDDESVNLDDMSETEGEELDKALSAAFNQFKPLTGKKTKKQSEDDRVLTHFRVRVLDLIKTYINTNPSMLLTIEILLPLLRLLEFSIRDSNQMPLRVPIQKCIEKMSQLKKFSSLDGVNETTLSELLKNLFDKGTRNVNLMRDMDVQFSHSCIFVMRCVQCYNNSEGTKKKSKKKLKSFLVEILSHEFNEFFQKRDNLTPYVLWKDLIGLDYDLSRNLSFTLIDNAFNPNVKLFKRSQALQLLIVLYSNHRLLASLTEDELDGLIEEFSKKSMELLHNLNNDTVNCIANEKLLATLFNCLLIIKKSPILRNNKLIDFEKVGELIRDIRSKLSMSTNCLNQYKALCKAIGVNCCVTMNGNLVSLGCNNKNEETVDEVIKGSKKRQKENRKKKKWERMKSLSEGLKENVTFDGVIEETDGNSNDSNKRKNNLNDGIVKRHKKSHLAS